MRFTHKAVIAGLTGLGLFACTVTGANAGDKRVPAAAVGASWDKDVQVSQGAAPPIAGATFSDQQISLINQINDYFMSLNKVKGRFVQTGSDNKRLRGKYYIKRPGRFRFDYNRPSRMVILSTGRKLIIQDYDLKTEDEIPLTKTPFRMLLRKNVNLLRDARIANLQETEDLAIIELLDKNPRIAGGIKLFLTKKPQLELKEWITTDVQGLKTRIELTKMVRVDKLSSKLFVHKSLLLPDFSRN